MILEIDQTFMNWDHRNHTLIYRIEDKRQSRQGALSNTAYRRATRDLASR